jgi:hypothetical protein
MRFESDGPIAIPTRPAADACTGGNPQLAALHNPHEAGDAERFGQGRFRQQTQIERPRLIETVIDGVLGFAGMVQRGGAAWIRDGPTPRAVARKTRSLWCSGFP